MFSFSLHLFHLWEIRNIPEHQSFFYSKLKNFLRKYHKHSLAYLSGQSNSYSLIRLSLSWIGYWFVIIEGIPLRPLPFVCLTEQISRYIRAYHFLELSRQHLNLNILNDNISVKYRSFECLRWIHSQQHISIHHLFGFVYILHCTHKLVKYIISWKFIVYLTKEKKMLIHVRRAKDAIQKTKETTKEKDWRRSWLNKWTLNNIETNTNSWDFVVYLICIKDCYKVKWQKHAESRDLFWGESYMKSKDKHKHYARKRRPAKHNRTKQNNNQEKEKTQRISLFSENKKIKKIKIGAGKNFVNMDFQIYVIFHRWQILILPFVWTPELKRPFEQNKPKRQLCLWENGGCRMVKFSLHRLMPYAR